MLKRISTKNLILGMYLHEFCGSWMEHPFWRAKFVLKDPKDLERIQATAIDEVWIDTSKGLDVAAGVISVSREEADLQIDSEFAAGRHASHRHRRAAAPCVASSGPRTHVDAR